VTYKIKKKGDSREGVVSEALSNNGGTIASPSHEPGFSENVATRRGLSSFSTPSLMLYSPTASCCIVSYCIILYRNMLVRKIMMDGN
jgi:hypothetical protein